MKLKYKKHIAPRLASLESRARWAQGLPPVMRDWIRMKAEAAKMSQSFWLETQLLEKVYPARRRREVVYKTPAKAANGRKEGT